LYGFRLCEEAADQMTTLPATHMGLSETHNLEFETQKSDRETLVVRAGSGRLDSWDKRLFRLTAA
jgi:hypothetical protein